MTTNPNVGSEPANGAAGTPNPAVSPQGTPPIEGADQLLSVLRGEISKQFETFGKELRGLQSRQDKTENRFVEQLAKLDKYEKNGLSRDEALAKMDADEAETNWRKNFEAKIDQLAALVGSAGTQPNRQQVVSEVFSNVGLDPKDPRVAAHLVKEYKDEKEMKLAAYELKEELSKTPSPTQAQGASLQGKPELKQSVEELANSYKSEMLAAPRGKAGEATRKAIMDKFKSQGVKVHEIDLT